MRSAREKDECTFTFLGLEDEHSELELEWASLVRLPGSP